MSRCRLNIIPSHTNIALASFFGHVRATKQKPFANHTTVAFTLAENQTPHLFLLCSALTAHRKKEGLCSLLAPHRVCCLMDISGSKNRPSLFQNSHLFSCKPVSPTLLQHKQEGKANAGRIFPLNFWSGRTNVFKFKNQSLIKDPFWSSRVQTYTLLHHWQWVQESATEHAAEGKYLLIKRSPKLPANLRLLRYPVNRCCKPFKVSTVSCSNNCKKSRVYCPI